MASAQEVTDRGLAAWRARDADAYAACYSDDAIITAPGGMEAHGPDGAKMFMDAWCAAFPDNEITIEHEHVAGSVVTQEGIFSGTHTGNLHTADGQTIAPTGRHVNAGYVDVFEIDGDVITSDRLMFDRLELLTQLGVVPEPAAAG
jgi:hypothetical protein